MLREPGVESVIGVIGRREAYGISTSDLKRDSKTLEKRFLEYLQNRHTIMFHREALRLRPKVYKAEILLGTLPEKKNRFSMSWLNLIYEE